MEEIKIFNNDEFGKVRIITIDNEPWFVGKDISEILKYKETANMRKLLDNCEYQEIDPQSIDFTGFVQNGTTLEPNKNIRRMLLINESGLYNAIFNSTLPSAIKFRRWVTSEVLPSIRKNGGYIQGQENLSDTELLAKAILVAQRTIEERDKKIAEQSSLIEEQKPLVTFALNVTDSEHSMDIGEFAKIVNKKDWNLGRNKLFRWLRDKKIFMESNVPYQKYIDNGYFTCIEVNKSSEYGSKNFSKSLITPKGQVWLTNKLQDFVDDYFTSNSKEE